jgi:hypothetical protein
VASSAAKGSTKIIGAGSGLRATSSMVEFHLIRFTRRPAIAAQENATTDNL